MDVSIEEQALRVCGSHIVIGVLKPNRDITIEGFALDVAGRALSAGCGLGGVHIGGVSCSWTGSRGSRRSNGYRRQRGDDNRGRETHLDGVEWKA